MILFENLFKDKNEKFLLDVGLLTIVVITVGSFSVFIYQNGWTKYDNFLGYIPFAAMFWAFFCSLFWLLVMYKIDFFKKENIETVGKILFITFFIASFLTTGIHYGIRVLFGEEAMYYAVGFVEEGTKILTVMFFVYNSKDFDEPMDGIFYAGVAGVAFSFSENIGYYIPAILYESANNTEMIIALIARFFTTLLHIVMSAIAGFMIGLYKFKYTTKTKVAVAFLVASLVHSLYDYFAIHRYHIYYGISILALNTVIIILAILYLHRISPYNRSFLVICKKCGYFMRENKTRCPHCATKISFLDTLFKSYDTYCSRCQTKVTKNQKTCSSCGFDFSIQPNL